MIISKGIKWIVYSNLWVALNVVAYYLVVVLITDLSVDYLYAPLLFLATVFAYNYQRLLKNESARENDFYSERHIWIENNQQFIKLLTILSGAGAIVISIFMLPLELMLMSVPALIIVMLYARKRDSLSALRNVPFLKILLISLVWDFVVLVLPLLLAREDFGIDEFGLSIQLLIFLIVMCIPFDIRDRKIDLGKIKTLPVVLGVKKSKYLAIVLMLTFGIWGAIDGVYSFSLITIIAVTSLIYTNETRKELFFTGWIEGHFLLLMLLQILIEVI